MDKNAPKQSLNESDVNSAESDPGDALEEDFELDFGAYNSERYVNINE